MNRNESRKIIMTILYQIFIYRNNNIMYEIDDVINENLNIKNEFAYNMVHGVLEKEKEIDDLANKYLKNWTINRLGLTDQAILKMGIYELKYTKTPSIVTINEAVELAKNYSDIKVKNMINAVLDNIYHEEV